MFTSNALKIEIFATEEFRNKVFKDEKSAVEELIDKAVTVEAFNKDTFNLSFIEEITFHEVNFELYSNPL